MKKFLFLTILPFLAMTAFAQSNVGVDLFLMGEYKASKEYFNKALSQNPEEANFYLGEMAFLDGNADQAKEYYQKGLAANAESVMNQIGLAKMTIKSNPKAAADAYKDIAKKNKKDVDTNLLIARAYFDAGDMKGANDYLEKARKINKKYPLLYILEGDMALKNDPGKAAGFYDQAVYFDPNFFLGYIKSAKVYSSINHALAVEKLEKAIQLNPNYTVAYKYLGEVNIKASRFEPAAAAFEKYFSFGNYSIGDIINYSSVLLSQGKHAESVQMVEEGLQRDPENYILHRLLMLNLVELKDYAKALTVAEKFFTLPNENPHIVKDYTSYALILKEHKDFDKSLEYYHLAEQEATKSDPTQLPTIYSEMAALYKSAKQLDKAAEFQQKYMDTADETDISMLDYYNLGNMFYECARSLDSTTVEDPSQLKAMISQYVEKADASYAIMIERLPDNHLGYLGQARAHGLLDPETTEGTARPYYEKLLEILESQGAEANKNALVEAYSYLGYFYYLKEDKENGIQYWEKLLEVDPGNANAQAVLESWK